MVVLVVFSGVLQNLYEIKTLFCKRKLNPTHSIPQSQIRLAEIIW